MNLYQWFEDTLRRNGKECDQYTACSLLAHYTGVLLGLGVPEPDVRDFLDRLVSTTAILLKRVNGEKSLGENLDAMLSRPVLQVVEERGARPEARGPRFQPEEPSAGDRPRPDSLEQGTLPRAFSLFRSPAVAEQGKEPPPPAAPYSGLAPQASRRESSEGDAPATRQDPLG